MRYYVECKVHPGTRHYVDMGSATTREDCLGAFAFPGCEVMYYTREDLIAESGVYFPTPALLWGALLFLEPLLFAGMGLLWLITFGRVNLFRNDQDRAAVEAFNGAKEA